MRRLTSLSAERVPLFVRLDPVVRQLVAENASENERSLNGEINFQLKRVYAEAASVVR
jgi:hypothetical protein